MITDPNYCFRATGKLIYSEPSNPYETVEIYLNYEYDHLALKSYISEHGPDGGSSWRGIYLDDENAQKLSKIVGEDLEAFFRTYLRQNSHLGLLGLTGYLKERDIEFDHKLAF